MLFIEFQTNINAGLVENFLLIFSSTRTKEIKT